MKKLIALVIAAVMVLSMVLVMTITTSAVDIEGDWVVYRSPEDYDVDLEAGEFYKPAPGYEYTYEGFTTIPADYTNMTPFFTVQTREAQSLKDGIYLQFRVDEYSYEGGDHWISFNLSDRANVQPGDIAYGNNWLTLMRGAGNGTTDCQSFVTTQTTEDGVGSFAHVGSTNPKIPMDDDGREIYTLEVEWTGSGYEVKVCGQLVAGNSTVSSKLMSFNENGISMSASPSTPARRTVRLPAPFSSTAPARLMPPPPSARMRRIPRRISSLSVTPLTPRPFPPMSLLCSGMRPDPLSLASPVRPICS